MFEKLPDELLTEIVLLTGESIPHYTVEKLSLLNTLTHKRVQLSTFTDCFLRKVLERDYGIEAYVKDPAVLHSHISSEKAKEAFVKSLLVFRHLDEIMSSEMLSTWLVTYIFGSIWFPSLQRLRQTLLVHYTSTLERANISVSYGVVEDLYKVVYYPKRKLAECMFQVFPDAVMKCLRSKLISELFRSFDEETLDYFFEVTKYDVLPRIYHCDYIRADDSERKRFHRELTKIKDWSSVDFDNLFRSRIGFDQVFLAKKLVECKRQIPIDMLCTDIDDEALKELLTMDCFQPITIADIPSLQLSFEETLIILQSPIMPQIDSLFSILASTEYFPTTMEALIFSGYAKGSLQTEKNEICYILCSKVDYIKRYCASPCYSYSDKVFVALQYIKRHYNKTKATAKPFEVTICEALESFLDSKSYTKLVIERILPISHHSEDFVSYHLFDFFSLPRVKLSSVDSLSLCIRTGTNKTLASKAQRTRYLKQLTEAEITPDIRSAIDLLLI